MDKYERARAELAEIDEKIEQLRHRREALLRFIEMGKILFNEAESKTTAHSPLRWRIGTELAHRHATMQDQIIRYAEELIEQAGHAHTRDIVQYAQLRGVNITGSDFQTKVMTTSAILSKSEKFVSDRRTGWKLRAENKNP